MYKQFIAACSLTGALMLSSCSPTPPVAHDVSIIPIPKEIKNANGQFTLKDGMTIGVADKQLLPAANYLSGLLSRSTGYIYNVREHIIHTVFQHQQHESESKGTDNPHKLLAGTGREVEEVAFAIVIAGSADAKPSANNQEQVNKNRYPVQRFPQTIVPRYHIISLCY